MKAGRVIVVLLFGFIVIYLPVRLFSMVHWPVTIGRFQVSGIVIGVIGAAITLSSASSFAFLGRGTPAPFAAPQRLVTRGLYRFVRNPMYIGVGLFFASAAIFYQSFLVLGYVAVFVVASDLFIVLYEEPTLRRTFDAEYSRYCGHVGRWWPRVRQDGWRVKARLTGYWIATALIGLETFAGGVTDLMRGRAALVSGPFVQDLIAHLGYPPYLLTILGFWKVFGAVVMCAPGLPRLKEWAYAGVFFELTGAAASFALHGDPATEMASPVLLAVAAIVSWKLRPPGRTLGESIVPQVPQ